MNYVPAYAVIIVTTPNTPTEPARMLILADHRTPFATRLYGGKEEEGKPSSLQIVTLQGAN